ncbi:MAG: 2OG-Fe(II) oxygenase [Alphaproteobacteria bacterium]|nr:2OG-Fe(II) oxygenase [Alphaproteobacteria bacterium]
MTALDLDRFAQTPLQRDPYDYLIVPGFVRVDALAPLMADFPAVDRPGSFPASVLDFGLAFRAFLDELEGPATRAAFASKFGLDLAGRPSMVTVRGRAQAKDGGIHTDSRSKIITALIYMNPSWGECGGRLRVLRGGDDLDDYAAEVPPDAGTLLAFRRGERSFHGHKPFEGVRRSVQLNWVRDAGVARLELLRHKLSAGLKRLLAAR